MKLKEIAGWNQTRDDWKNILAMPGNHLGLYERNQLVATSCALDYMSFIWIAMVLVHPDFRRRGLATSLVKKLIDFFPDKTLCLDATDAGSPVYQKLGFINADRVLRLKNTIVPAFPKNSKQMGIKICGFDQDKYIFEGDRIPLLNKWKNNVIALNEENYIFNRAGSEAVQLGPLVAEDFDNAEKLLNKILGKVNGAVIIDIPDREEWLIKLKVLGFKVERTFNRMVKSPESKDHIIHPHIWATAGPEFG